MWVLFGYFLNWTPITRLVRGYVRINTTRHMIKRDWIASVSISYGLFQQSIMSIPRSTYDICIKVNMDIFSKFGLLGWCSPTGRSVDELPILVPTIYGKCWNRP